MISLLDTVKYIGLAAIIYFLLKAFAKDMSNKKIAIIVGGIMILVIFINTNSTSCPKQVVREKYNPTEPPIVPSIYAEPSHADEKPLEKTTESINFDLPKSAKDKDIENLKDIVGINKKIYEELKDEEKAAMAKIAAKYRDEMVYTETHPFNTVPLGTQLYGYTYLPPENWFRAYERPPVCVTDNRCPVVPVYTSKGTSELMEFDTTNNVMGPEGINLRFIRKILNDGIKGKHNGVSTDDSEPELNPRYTP